MAFSKDFNPIKIPSKTPQITIPIIESLIDKLSDTNVSIAEIIPKNINNSIIISLDA